MHSYINYVHYVCMPDVRMYVCSWVNSVIFWAGQALRRLLLYPINEILIYIDLNISPIASVAPF